MPPKLGHRRTAADTRTRTVKPRSMETQTSGIFKLPLEIFLEIFSYLADHRHFIRENYYGRESNVRMERKHAERSVVIRRLTMTCRPLRIRLLPLLWTHVEGCISHLSYDCEVKRGILGSSPYAQCVYLISNRVIATCVQTLSVKLCFPWALEDLMTKFIDCLVRLPNLKTLEILSISSGAPISKALKRKNAIFPSIRELRITRKCHHFVRNCPNLENLTLTDGFDIHSPDTIRSHGRGLLRIAGVSVYTRNHGQGVDAVAWGCPNLREIGIVDHTHVNSETIKGLRRLKHLAIVDVELENAIDRETIGALVKGRKMWRRELIGLLKDSPSTERKFLRWKIAQSYMRQDGRGRAYVVVTNEELEVFPETPL